MTSPVLAIGCADGMVRLVHLATLRVVGRLAGNPKGAISCLMVLPSAAGQGPVSDLLVAGDTSGALMVWAPFGSPLGAEVPPKLALNGGCLAGLCQCAACGIIDASVARARRPGSGNAL
jgi:hypothetical protein